MFHKLVSRSDSPPLNTRCFVRCTTDRTKVPKEFVMKRLEINTALIMLADSKTVLVPSAFVNPTGIQLINL